uniref:NADH-ubiquinone oxidoreductase chain 2 n=1 Tax=Thrips hawaiiensis TaxID=163894 RepID=A0A8A0Y207_9NEOP|nr:NADH dehydrogenase subunit 2 [Thrips hawaiiensis]QSQ87285.1 NADH dehydrogenase subunit 2 [Thrips hawaiiensis]
MFLISLISSILICISSNSILTMWMSMEINLFSMIPIISLDQKLNSEKSSMVYFLVQSISSTMILMSICLESMDFNYTPFSTFMMVGIFMKLGLFPFHQWMMSAIEGMSWFVSFFLMTIQKIIPLMVIMQFSEKKIIIFLCLLNSLFSSIMSITMFSMRKIMIISSMNHLSLMIISLMLSKTMLKIYFIIYSTMTFMATKLFEKLQVNFIFQTMTLIKKNKINNMIFLTIFLSMAGVPPFLGFMPKMLTIMLMMKSKMILTVMLILVFNSLSTFMYLRASLNNILMNLNINKIKKKDKKSDKFPLFMILSPLIILLM